MRIISILITLIVMTSCASTPIDSNPYNGNFAVIDDSYINSGKFGGRTDYFVIKSIQGKEQYNAYDRAISKPSNNYNQFGYSHKIEAKTLTIEVASKKFYRNLLFDMAADNVEFIDIEGEINFKPIKGKHYLVKGRILKNYSAVWIEDEKGNIASDIVESNSNRSEFLKNEKTSKAKTTISKLFSNLITGESTQLVVNKFGQPDEVLHPTRNTTYIYRSLGKIKFTRHSKNEAYVDIVIPKIDSTNLSRNSVRSLIQPATGRTIRELAKEFYNLNIQDVDILDVFAEKIWKERNHTNRYMIDGITWLCKILGQSKNGRYKQLLEKLLEPNQSSLKKAHIKKSIDELSIYENSQFKFNN